MFIFWNSLSGKLFFKLSCIYLLLGKLINRKHFPVNGKHFSVNGNTFRLTKNTFQSTETQLKKNLVWFSGKCFPFWLCLFSGKWFPGKHFSKLSCVYLLLEKLVNGKHFPVKEIFGLVFRKVFS